MLTRPQRDLSCSEGHRFPGGRRASREAPLRGRQPGRCSVLPPQALAPKADSFSPSGAEGEGREGKAVRPVMQVTSLYTV